MTSSMKRFVIKSIYFAGPFLLLYVVNFLFYSQREGDLVRLGYLYSNPSPSSKVIQKYNPPSGGFYRVSELKDTIVANEFTALIIGDSFSDQKFGYRDYLAKIMQDSLLYWDRPLIDKNPIQTLIALMNSGYFDKVRVDFVILQNVERDFLSNTQKLEWEKAMNESSQKQFAKPKNRTRIPALFSDATLKIPLTNLLYHYDSRPLDVQTYKVTTNNSELFSYQPKTLLFFEEDIFRLKQKNSVDFVISSNQEINQVSDKLRTKGIKLILLISPDKYDIYYPYIDDKRLFTQPEFFREYRRLRKSYIYIDVEEQFSAFIESKKDLYLYDDTHWGPEGARLVADMILDSIRSDKR